MENGMRGRLPVSLPAASDELEIAVAIEPKDPPEDPRKKVDLPRYRRMFERWRDLTLEARKEQLIDDNYYHGRQLTADEERILADRGQPRIIINRVRAAINGILGVVERGRSEPRAYPRAPGDDDAADVATDVLRYIGDHNRFHKLKMRVFRDMLVPGTAAALVTVNNDLEVVIQRIRFEEFFFDPASREEDFSDARYTGIAKWIYADDLAARYPNDREAINSCVEGAVLFDDATADRPRDIVWTDRRERRLMVVEVYHREDGWKRCVFYQQGVLDYGDSPYLDDKGRPCNPIEAVSAYVDQDNNRIGAVRDMRGPQDEINKRRSKLLHLINTAQVQMVDQYGSQYSKEEAREEAAKPNGVIPPGWQRIPTSDMASGQAGLLQEAKNEIERLGPNPAVVGRDSAGASGRALQARTQAGLIELAILYGELEDWELRVWRQCWARARQYWRAPQWIRVTDDEEAPKYVGLNMPKGPPRAMHDPATGQLLADPETGQPKIEDGQVSHLPIGPDGQPVPVFGFKNAIAEMDVDIILDTTPDTANIQAEQFQDLAQLAANPLYAQQVPFEVMLDLSAIPHKRRIIGKLKELREAREKAQAAQAEQQAQILQARLEAEIGATKSKSVLNTAQAQAAVSGAEVDAFNAQVDADKAAIEAGVALNGAMQSTLEGTGQQPGY